MRTVSPSGTAHPRRGRGALVFVELVRLAVVVLATAGAFEGADNLSAETLFGQAGESLVLLVTVAGAGAGYVLGGVLGRFSLGRIDATERSLSSISSGELLAGLFGGFAGFAASVALVWPVLLFDAKYVTVPVAGLVMLMLTTTGLRIGLSRGGDLLRFVGASGRLPSGSPAKGAKAKVVDTSALIDGRILDVCRAGFLEGTLVLPRFVLYELQGIADSSDESRRDRGRRGLDVLGGLQRSSGVALEVTDRDYPEVDTVDAKLVAMARHRGAGLVTVDGNLGRVAEIQGVKVLNLNSLAETLRPPVLPGDILNVRVVKAGKEAGQGVGYLSDGTMVIVEGGRDRQGSEVSGEVTSILSNPNGRMVFVTLTPKPQDRDRGAGPQADADPARLRPHVAAQ